MEKNLKVMKANEELTNIYERGKRQEKKENKEKLKEYK